MKTALRCPCGATFELEMRDDSSWYREHIHTEVQAWRDDHRDHRAPPGPWTTNIYNAGGGPRYSHHVTEEGSMSWSLSASGHSEDPDVNATVDALVKRLVDELVDSGSPAQGSYSNGATGESITIDITVEQPPADAAPPAETPPADGGAPPAGQSGQDGAPPA